jgi:hypothetical protein
MSRPCRRTQVKVVCDECGKHVWCTIQSNGDVITPLGWGIVTDHSLDFVLDTCSKKCSSIAKAKAEKRMYE